MLGLLLPVIVACGVYSFRGSLPEGVSSVAVPLMTNETAEPDVAETITDEVISRFETEGIFRLEPRDRADAVLLLTLTDLTESANVYDVREEVQDVRVTLRVTVDLVRLADGENLLHLNLSSWGTFDLAGGDRREALAEASQKLVEDITTKLLSGW